MRKGVKTNQCEEVWAVTTNNHTFWSNVYKMILDIIKENQEIKNLLLEQNKQVIELHKENNILHLFSFQTPKNGKAVQG